MFWVFSNSKQYTIRHNKRIKKKTLEEYRNRIKKQLYSNDNDLYQESINQYKSQKIDKKNLSKWQKTHPLLRVLYIILGLIIGLFIYFSAIHRPGTYFRPS